jgi:hypothetical protein
LPVTPEGLIDLRAVVQAGVKALAAAQAAGGRAVVADALSLDAVKAREIKLRGDRLQLLVDQLSADLIAAEVIEEQVGAAFDAVRQKVLAIPAACAPRLALTTDPVQTRELLTKAVHDALNDLAEHEVIDAIKDRARRLVRRNEDVDEAGEEAGAAA